MVYLKDFDSYVAYTKMAQSHEAVYFTQLCGGRDFGSDVGAVTGSMSPSSGDEKCLTLSSDGHPSESSSPPASEFDEDGSVFEGNISLSTAETSSVDGSGAVSELLKGEDTLSPGSEDGSEDEDGSDEDGSEDEDGSGDERSSPSDGEAESSDDDCSRLDVSTCATVFFLSRRSVISFIVAKDALNLADKPNRPTVLRPGILRALRLLTLENSHLDLRLTRAQYEVALLEQEKLMAGQRFSSACAQCRISEKDPRLVSSSNPPSTSTLSRPRYQTATAAGTKHCGVFSSDLQIQKKIRV